MNQLLFIGKEQNSMAVPWRAEISSKSTFFSVNIDRPTKWNQQMEAYLHSLHY